MSFLKSMQQFLDTRIWSNSVQEWLIAFLIFFAILFSLYIFKKFILGKLYKLAEKTSSNIDNILIQGIRSIASIFYIFIAAWVASQFVHLPNLIVQAINWTTLAIMLYYITLTFQNLIEYLIDSRISAKKDSEEGGDIGSTLVVKKFIKQIFKILLWVIALLLLLQNLGVQISVLLGGLGVAGLAIGFAVQNILEDIFSFFSIYFDKPFEIGDFIVVGEESGTVEAVGIKSTRIRSLQGQELVVSNKELISSQIHNFRKMLERRIAFTFGITYETDYSKLEKVNSIVKDIFEEIKNARIDRVHFHEYGDFALTYEVVYYVASQDYYEYMDVQQKVNLALFKEFEKEGIEFAYPTSRVLLDKN